MFPRWLWLNHIPAGLDLTPEQRLEVRQRVRTMRAGRQGGSGVGKAILLRLLPGIFGLSLVFLVWILWLTRAKLPPARFAVANVLGILLFHATLWIIIAWSVNRAMAQAVWRALNQIGFRVCERCGYILDYLPADAARCPECGEALRPAPTPPHSPPASPPASSSSA